MSEERLNKIFDECMKNLEEISRNSIETRRQFDMLPGILVLTMAGCAVAIAFIAPFLRWIILPHN